MAVTPIHLGPFTLGQPIGRGGMGEVWSARHDDGEDVAVKVLSWKRGTDDTARALFEGEVRAVATLDHPGVVTVYDYGTVTSEASQASGGRLRAGASYLVMELLPDGSLRDLTRRVGEWASIEAALQHLLAALAHAHAHGVIHRDLKASNVLRAGDRVVLTDFGLAHLQHTTLDDATHRSGTPTYMAPEQFAGAWRDFGPWTDLYALGVLCWRMLTGRSPWGQLRSWTSAAAAHLYAPLPHLESRVEVPRGLEEWLERMLHKDPGRRYGRAADAARDLAALGPVVRDPTPMASARIDPDAPTVTLQDGAAVEAPQPLAAPAPPPTPPVLPPRWPSDERRPRWLSGAGLGLFGLRTLPLVDREEARSALWDSAREVLAEQGARAVILRGPAGTGKSRLAAWAVQQLEQRGALQKLRAVHSPDPTPADGLDAMLRRMLRVHELDATALRARLEGCLSRLGLDQPDLVDLVEAMVQPGGSPESLGARTRHQVLRVLCTALADVGRPAVLWLDDVQWGGDALDASRKLLAAGSPVLLLMTAREEALAERPMQAAVLDALAGRDDVRQVRLGPLAPEDRAALVGGLLGLAPALAGEVERRTAGNPLFAVQLVGDWVHRSLLVEGPSGFELAPGAEGRLPDDVHAMWRGPVDRLLRGRPASDAVALELAALLGQTVDADEWRAVAAAAGVVPSPGLVEALLRRRLAREPDADGGWSFVHGMLRESLVRRVEDAGTAAARHSAVAEGLRACGASTGRVGLHLLAAGQLEAAVTALLAATEQARRGQRVDEASRIADAARQGLDALQVGEADPRRLELALLDIELTLGRNQLEEGRLAARELAQWAFARGLVEWGGRARVIEGRVHLIRREHAEAERALREGMRMLGDDDPHTEGTARTCLAAVAYGRGDNEAARAQLGLARARFDALGDVIGACRVLMLEGASWEQEDRIGEARRCFQELLAQLDGADELVPILRGSAHNGLAMVGLAQGDAAAAEHHIERALALARLWGGAVPAIQMDQATIVLRHGRVAEARAILEEALEGLRAEGQPVRVQQCAARLTEPTAVLGDRAATEAALDEASGLLDGETTERPGAEHLTEAARACIAHGWNDLAVRAATLALSQWQRLGEDARVAEVRTMLEGLRSGA